jgi:hypothetical protein
LEIFKILVFPCVPTKFTSKLPTFSYRVLNVFHHVPNVFPKKFQHLAQIVPNSTILYAITFGHNLCPLVNYKGGPKAKPFGKSGVGVMGDCPMFQKLIVMGQILFFL